MMSISMAREAIGARRFCFGGVELDVLSAADFTFELPPDHQRFVSVDGGRRMAPRVACNVTLDSSLDHDSPHMREIVHDGHDLRTTGVRAQVNAVAEGSWAATARVASGMHSLGRMLDAVSAVVTEQHGGLVMHGAGVEYAGSGYLFVGPSGAGKTTAAGQVFGARSFCVDRATVLPGPRGWQLHALPGGTDPIHGAPPSEHVVLPLAGILRVSKSTELDVHRLAPHEALMTLRESVFSAGRDRGAEMSRLDAMLRLAADIPVVRLQCVLGAPVAQCLQNLGSQNMAEAGS